MNTQLVSKAGSTSVDNLFARLEPRAEAIGVTIEKLTSGAADVTLKRGTLLGVKANGKMAIYGGSVTSKTQKFSGDASTTTFTVTDKPTAILGVTVGTAAATVSDYNPYTGVVTLSAAPAAGTNNVTVSYNLDTGLAPYCILTDDATITDDADVVATAYRNGTFNKAAIKVDTGYTITAADIQTLNAFDIHFMDVL